MDLPGKVELPVRILKDFQASSVSLVRRDLRIVDSKEAMWSGFRVLGSRVGSLAVGSEEDDGSLLRAKIEG